ncbi:unnamed protein product, partial [Oppiella nova]
MLCGQRPYDIHSTTPLAEVLAMQRKEFPPFPAHISHACQHLIQRLLNTAPDARIQTVADMKRCSAYATLDFDAVLRREEVPTFVPPKDQLNCDPTFELEEMIIEANPLHKKKKRLQKQQSMRRVATVERQNSSLYSESGPSADEGMTAIFTPSTSITWRSISPAMA